MGFLDRFLGKKVKRVDSTPNQAVLVCFLYGSTDLSRLFALERQLEQAIDAAGVGEFDGNEIAVDGSDGTLFMYGRDADALFSAIRPILEASEFLNGARVILQYGPPEEGVCEKEIVIGTDRD